MAYLQSSWKLILALFAAVLMIALTNYSLDYARSYKQLKLSANMKQFQLPPQDKQVTMKKKEKGMNSKMASPHIDHKHPVCKTFLSKKQKEKQNHYNINMNRNQPPTAPMHKTKEKKTIADNIASKSIGNMVIYKRYPGLMFLPNYKLQHLTTPDNITGLDRLLKDITESEAEQRFDSLITTRHVNCTNMQRMGKTDDGGWDICISEPYNPKNNCLVYSFGINNDFSFDDAMGSYYGCIVKAFDPSMHVGDHMHSNRVWFYEVGLGAENAVNRAGWRLETLGSILSQAHDLNNIIDVLKFDIEFSEWSCLCTMFNEGVLHNVRQLVFEIHIGRQSSAQDYYDMMEILLEIERIGFRRFHYHRNPACQYRSKRSGKQLTYCYELFYINTNFLPDDANEKSGLGLFKMFSRWF